MLHTDPNTQPAPIKSARKYRMNAPAIRSGDRYERATIFAAEIDDLNAALAYYSAHNRPNMSTAERCDRAAHMADKFNAEARHLIFAHNPDA